MLHFNYTKFFSEFGLLKPNVDCIYATFKLHKIIFGIGLLKTNLDCNRTTFPIDLKGIPFCASLSEKCI